MVSGKRNLFSSSPGREGVFCCLLFPLSLLSSRKMITPGARNTFPDSICSSEQSLPSGNGPKRTFLNANPQAPWVGNEEISHRQRGKDTGFNDDCGLQLCAPNPRGRYPASMGTKESVLLSPGNDDVASCGWKFVF